jgi:hypothetical protein
MRHARGELLRISTVNAPLMNRLSMKSNKLVNIGTELGDWGFMPTDPLRLSAELQKRELTLLGSWVSVFLHDASKHAESEAEVVRTARLLKAVGGNPP